MKKLILLRHGKSDWSGGFSGDHDRPLNPRGERAARGVGHFLRDANQIPDAVLTSSAVRARTTAELAVEAGEWECPIEITEGLYATSSDSALRHIRSVADGVDTLLLAGHEPTWSELAGRLAGGASVRVVTATLVCLGFEIRRWSQVDYDIGTLLWLVPPKLYVKP